METEIKTNISRSYGIDKGGNARPTMQRRRAVRAEKIGLQQRNGGFGDKENYIRDRISYVEEKKNYCGYS